MESSQQPENLTELGDTKIDLEDSESRLELLSNTVPAMIFYIDAEQRYRSYNETFMRWFAVGKTEAIGKTVREFIGEQAYSKVLPHLLKAYAGEQETYEMSAPSRIGTDRWLHIVYTPHKTEDGTVVGVIVLATDITKTKQTEIALRQSEQFTRTIFDSSPAAMLIYTGDNMVLQHANKKMLEVLGSNSSIIGRSILEVMPTLRKSPILEHYNKVRATGENHHEYALRVELLKDGQSYWGYFDYTYAPLRNAEGTIYGVICTAIDVTDRVVAQQAQEEKEAALRNAVKLAELGTWTMNVSTGVMIFSRRHAELWGFDSVQTTAEEAISRIVEEDRERVSRAFYHALQPGSDGRYEAEYSVANGDRIIVRALGQTTYDNDGRAVTITGTTQDITIQRRTQAALEAKVQQRTKELAEAIESLNAINKELQRSNHHLEEFTHAASHDLKEPIRKIRFFTNHLKNQLNAGLKEEEIRSFNRIENATDRMGNLIDDLLLYSHVSQRPHQKELIDTNETVKKVLEDLELEIEQKKANVKTTDLPTVNGYPRQLQQLFQNLIANALKYSKPGSPPLIQVDSSVVSEDGRAYHLFEVKDNGIGFEPEYADRIFQMFTRLHGKNEYSGTGVGLSIVKKIVENHQGFVKAESEKGVGSIFKIYLPAI